MDRSDRESTVDPLDLDYEVGVRQIKDEDDEDDDEKGTPYAQTPI